MNIELHPSGGFRLEIPSVTDAHSVFIPCSERGVFLLRRILQKYAAEGDRKIGHDASPTQAQVDAWLRANAEAKTEALLASLNFDLEITL